MKNKNSKAGSGTGMVKKKQKWSKSNPEPNTIEAFQDGGTQQNLNSNRTGSEFPPPSMDDSGMNSDMNSCHPESGDQNLSGDSYSKMNDSPSGPQIPNYNGGFNRGNFGMNDQHGGGMGNTGNDYSQPTSQFNQFGQQNMRPGFPSNTNMPRGPQGPSRPSPGMASGMMPPSFTPGQQRFMSGPNIQQQGGPTPTLNQLLQNSNPGQRFQGGYGEYGMAHQKPGNESMGANQGYPQSQSWGSQQRPMNPYQAAQMPQNSQQAYRSQGGQMYDPSRRPGMNVPPGYPQQGGGQYSQGNQNQFSPGGQRFPMQQGRQGYGQMTPSFGSQSGGGGAPMGSFPPSQQNPHLQAHHQGGMMGGSGSAGSSGGQSGILQHSPNPSSQQNSTSPGPGAQVTNKDSKEMSQAAQSSTSEGDSLSQQQQQSGCGDAPVQSRPMSNSSSSQDAPGLVNTSEEEGDKGPGPNSVAPTTSTPGSSHHGVSNMRPAPSPAGSTGSRSNTPASLSGNQGGSPMPPRPPSNQLEGNQGRIQSPMANQNFGPQQSQQSQQQQQQQQQPGGGGGGGGGGGQGQMMPPPMGPGGPVSNHPGSNQMGFPGGTPNKMPNMMPGGQPHPSQMPGYNAQYPNQGQGNYNRGMPGGYGHQANAYGPNHMGSSMYGNNMGMNRPGMPSGYPSGQQYPGGPSGNMPTTSSPMPGGGNQQFPGYPNMLAQQSQQGQPMSQQTSQTSSLVPSAAAGPTTPSQSVNQPPSQVPSQTGGPPSQPSGNQSQSQNMSGGGGQSGSSPVPPTVGVPSQTTPPAMPSQLSPGPKGAQAAAHAAMLAAANQTAAQRAPFSGRPGSSGSGQHSPSSQGPTPGPQMPTPQPSQPPPQQPPQQSSSSASALPTPQQQQQPPQPGMSPQPAPPQQSQPGSQQSAPMPGGPPHQGAQMSSSTPTTPPQQHHQPPSQPSHFPPQHPQHGQRMFPGQGPPQHSSQMNNMNYNMQNQTHPNSGMNQMGSHSNMDSMAMGSGPGRGAGGTTGFGQMGPSGPHHMGGSGQPSSMSSGPGGESGSGMGINSMPNSGTMSGMNSMPPSSMGMNMSHSGNMPPNSMPMNANMPANAMSMSSGGPQPSSSSSQSGSGMNSMSLNMPPNSMGGMPHTGVPNSMPGGHMNSNMPPHAMANMPYHGSMGGMNSGMHPNSNMPPHNNMPHGGMPTNNMSNMNMLNNGIPPNAMAPSHMSSANSMGQHMGMGPQGMPPRGMMPMGSQGPMGPGMHQGGMGQQPDGSMDMKGSGDVNSTSSSSSASDIGDVKPTVSLGITSAGDTTTSVTQSITSPLTNASELSMTMSGSRPMGPPPVPPRPASQSSESSSSQDHMQHDMKIKLEENMSHPATPASVAPSPATSMHDDDTVSSPSMPGTPLSNQHKTEKSPAFNDTFNKQCEMGEEPSRRMFLERLFLFMDDRVTPITNMPSISKTPIDLFKLYSLVKERGGMIEVTKGKKWREVSGALNIGASSSAGFTLRKNYGKLVFPLECKFDRGDVDPMPLLAQMETPSKKTTESRKNNQNNTMNAQDPFRPPNSQGAASYNQFPPNMPRGPAMGGGGDMHGPMMPPNVSMMPTYPDTGMPPGMPGPGMPPGMPPHMGGNSNMMGPPGNMMGPPNAMGGQGMMGPGSMPQHTGMPNNMTQSPVPPMAGSSSGMMPNRTPIMPPPPSSDSMTAQNPFADNGSSSNQFSSGANSSMSNSPGFPSGMHQTPQTSSASSYQGFPNRPSSASSINNMPTEGMRPDQYPSNNRGTPDSTGSSGMFPAKMSSSGSQFGPQQGQGSPLPFPSRMDSQSQSHSPSYTPPMGPTASSEHQGFPGTPNPQTPTPINRSSTPLEQFPNNTSSSSQPPQSSAPQQTPLQPHFGTPSQSSSQQGGYPHQQNRMGEAGFNSGYQGNGPQQQQQGYPQHKMHPGGPPHMPPYAQKSFQDMGNYNMASHSSGYSGNYGDRYPTYSQAPHASESMQSELRPVSHSEPWGPQTGPPQSHYSNNTYSNTSSMPPTSAPGYGPMYNGRPGMSPQRPEKCFYPGSKHKSASMPPNTFPPKKEISFPPDSVEATQPRLIKRRKVTPKDIGQLDAWRLMMSLRSGLLVESTWALDTLSILLYDDHSVAWFGLQHLPGLIEILLDHFRCTLINIFGSDFNDIEVSQDKSFEEEEPVDTDDTKWVLPAGQCASDILTKHASPKKPHPGASEDGDGSEYGKRASMEKEIEFEKKEVVPTVEQESEAVGEEESKENLTVLPLSALPFLKMTPGAIKLPDPKELADPQNYTMKTRDGRKVKIESNPTEAKCMFDNKLWDVYSSFESCAYDWQMGRADTSIHILTRFQSNKSLEFYHKCFMKAEHNSHRSNCSYISKDTTGCSTRSQSPCCSNVDDKTNIKTECDLSCVKKETVCSPPGSPCSAKAAGSPKVDKCDSENSELDDKKAECGAADDHCNKCDRGACEDSKDKARLQNEEAVENDSSKCVQIKIEPVDKMETTTDGVLENEEGSLPTPEGADKPGSSPNSPNNNVKKGCEIRTEHMDIEIGCQELERLKRKWNEDEHEPEAYSHDQQALCVRMDSQEETSKRCLCLSNIIRSLSFVPGNDLELARHRGLMLVLGKLLLLHHQHPQRSPDQRKFDREVDAEHDEPVEDLTKEWWWETLDHLREDVLVIVANIAGKVNMREVPEEICHALFDGLLHWAVCPSAYAQDPMPTMSANSVLSPKRLVLETLCKLCVTDSNVDLLLATPPFSRIVQFLAMLVNILGNNPEQVMREFAIVLLSSFSQVESSAARAIALQHSSISLLLEFIEKAEQQAIQIAQTHAHGISMLQDNPEMMGTSLDMLRRAAITLRCMAEVPLNRPLFMHHQHRLLQLVMSQILDQKVASILSDVLYNCAQSS